MNGRELTRSLIGSLASYALFRTLSLKDAFAGSVKQGLGSGCARR